MLYFEPLIYYSFHFNQSIQLTFIRYSLQMKNLIRVERGRKNITRAELAEIIHVSRQSIHAIETGKFILSTLPALKMANYFGCNDEDIFTREETDLQDTPNDDQIQPLNL